MLVLLSPCITPTSLPLQTAISGLPVSATLQVCILSLFLPCVRAFPCICVCVRYCNVHVTSPKQASRKQMGSWKATSHIVTDEIPFFCPRSWWRWWLLSHSTGQTRGRSPTLCSHEQTAQMSTSSSNPLPPFFFSSHHFIESISLHKFINVTWKINIKSLHITANLPQAFY